MKRLSRKRITVQKIFAIVTLIVLIFCIAKQMIIQNSANADSELDVSMEEESVPEATTLTSSIPQSQKDSPKDASIRVPKRNSDETEGDAVEAVDEYSDEVASDPVDEMTSDPVDIELLPEYDEYVLEHEDDWYMILSEDEIQLLAATVYLEGGIESEECQKAIASVILNRMTTDNASLQSVIYAPSQFDVAPYVAYTTAPEDTVEYCRHVLHYGPTIPEYVTFFRANYYFDWGDRYRNYTHIDNTYFTYDTYLKARLEK